MRPNKCFIQTRHYSSVLECNRITVSFRYGASRQYKHDANKQRAYVTVCSNKETLHQYIMGAEMLRFVK